MKKILMLIIICLFSLSVRSQVIINQYVVEEPPYAVGDVITINYEIIDNVGGLQYLWFRYHYSNKHIELIPNSIVFHQGEQTQNFFHQWVGYNFNSNPNIGVGDLYGQYSNSTWNYVLDNNWNVVQLALQKSTTDINGLFASQKFLIKDNQDYNNIHRLHMAYVTDNNGIAVQNIGSQVLWLSLNDIKTIANFKIHLHHPQGYDIQKHKVNLKKKDSNDILESKNFDSSGEIIFTGILNDTEYYVEIESPINESFMDEIVSVSDAYKGFLQITDKGLLNDVNIFTHPIKHIVGNVKMEGEGFTNIDSYYLFAHVMGINVSDKAIIPSSSSNIKSKFYWGEVSTYNNGGLNKIIYPTKTNSVFNFAYAWGGDIDLSHSTPIYNQSSSGRIKQNKYKEENIEIISRLENGNVVVRTKLDSDNLSGLQIVLNYDDNLLSLENIIFDTGNTITNFKRVYDGKISFGSIDQIGNSTIKKNQPYKLIFKPKTNITNASGLIYIQLTDAVDKKGNKIKLNIK
jgi:hypothetical protein